MNTLERFKRGAVLTKDSLLVLKNHPKLLFFPIIAGISALAFLGMVGGTFVGLLAAEIDSLAVVITLAVLAYFGTATVSVFFTAALVSEAKQVFEGTQPSLKRGIDAAWQVKEKLLLWGVISAAIGIILDNIGGSDSRIGQVIALMWTIATFFVIPVAVLRPELSVREWFSKSGATFKEQWGETPIAVVGLKIVAIPFYVVGIGLGYLVVEGMGQAMLVGALVALPFIAVGMIITSALRGVLKAALYTYATEGKRPKEFDGENFDDLGTEKNAQI